MTEMEQYLWIKVYTIMLKKEEAQPFALDRIDAADRAVDDMRNSRLEIEE
jgi:hypothetical protein|tara:strand:+ start:5310 stop:5459 length:150 start_codon:yes stop_codon:yes gene_type:complete